MYAVREEVEVLKEQIKELYERNSVLERENAVLKSLANSEQLSQLSTQSTGGSVSTPPQQGLSQHQQPAQHPLQAQPQQQSYPQVQHHPKPPQPQTQLDPGQQPLQPNVTSAWSASARLRHGGISSASSLQLITISVCEIKKKKKKLCLLSHQLDHKVQCLCVSEWVSKQRVTVKCVCASVLWAFPVLMQSPRLKETWTENVCVESGRVGRGLVPPPPYWLWSWRTGSFPGPGLSCTSLRPDLKAMCGHGKGGAELT